MRVLCCGDRNWGYRGVIRRVLTSLTDRPITVVHGACRGADEIAASIATTLGMATEAHPADWNKHGKAAGPIRNQAMLESGIDLVLAFHNDIDASKGTADMVRRAQSAGVKTKVITSGL